MLSARNSPNPQRHKQNENEKLENVILHKWNLEANKGTTIINIKADSKTEMMKKKKYYCKPIKVMLHWEVIIINIHALNIKVGKFRKQHERDIKGPHSVSVSNFQGRYISKQDHKQRNITVLTILPSWEPCELL